MMILQGYFFSFFKQIHVVLLSKRGGVAVEEGLRSSSLCVYFRDVEAEVGAGGGG